MSCLFSTRPVTWGCAPDSPAICPLHVAVGWTRGLGGLRQPPLIIWSPCLGGRGGRVDKRLDNGGLLRAEEEGSKGEGGARHSPLCPLYAHGPHMPPKQPACDPTWQGRAALHALPSPQAGGVRPYGGLPNIHSWATKPGQSKLQAPSILPLKGEAPLTAQHCSVSLSSLLVRTLEGACWLRQAKSPALLCPQQQADRLDTGVMALSCSPLFQHMNSKDRLGAASQGSS